MRPLIAIPCLLLGLALSASAQTPKPVSVQLLKELAAYPQRSAPATVISLNQPQISAEVSARLQSFSVRVGDRVAAGDILAQLDCRELQLGLRSAEAQFNNVQARLGLARSRMEQAQSLITNQLLSQDDLDSRRSELNVLEADLQNVQALRDTAQLRVDRCNIRAPFDGLVLHRLAQSGQWLSPGTPVISLQDLSRIEISAQIYSADANLISADTLFRMETSGDSRPVSLRTLVDAIDPVTRNREARFEFSEEPTLIGASGKVVWRDPRPHLPPELFIDRNGQLGVFVVRDGKAVFVVVNGAQPGRSNPVDISLETAVVTDGYLGLLEGDAISIRVP